MSPATVVYPEVIAGLTHKPLPRRRRVVNNRRAATEGRRTQTQISIKVKDGCAVEQELLIDTSLIHEEGSSRRRGRKHMCTVKHTRGLYVLLSPSLPHVTHAHISCCGTRRADQVGTAPATLLFVCLHHLCVTVQIL